MTPLWSLKSTPMPSELGVQLSASTRLELERGRVGDAEELADLAEHAESTLIAHGDRVDRPVGTTIAARTVPPGLTEAEPELPPLAAELPPVSLAPPHAATIAPSNGMDMPITVRGDELPTGEPSRDQLIDQMVFELSALTPDVVHRSSWFSGMR